MGYMSQEGYDKLVADLHHLEAIERPKASAAIAEAADKGDLSENSEYDAAKDRRHEQALDRCRANHVESGNDQPRAQQEDDLYHRQRERSRLEVGQDFHQDPHRARLAQQEGRRHC